MRKLYVDVINLSGATIPANSLVAVNGTDSGTGLPTIIVADYSIGTATPAVGVLTATTTSGSVGLVKTQGLAEGFNTSTSSINAPVFLGLAGGISFVNPSTYSDLNYTQQIGIVSVVSSAQGILLLQSSYGDESLSSGGGSGAEGTGSPNKIAYWYNTSALTYTNNLATDGYSLIFSNNSGISVGSDGTNLILKDTVAGTKTLSELSGGGGGSGNLNTDGSGGDGYLTFFSDGYDVIGDPTLLWNTAYKFLSIGTTNTYGIVTIGSPFGAGGSVTPDVDNSVGLAQNSYRWTNAYFGPQGINISTNGTGDTGSVITSWGIQVDLTSGALYFGNNSAETLVLDTTSNLTLNGNGQLRINAGSGGSPVFTFNDGSYNGGMGSSGGGFSTDLYARGSLVASFDQTLKTTLQGTLVMGEIASAPLQSSLPGGTLYVLSSDHNLYYKDSTGTISKITPPTSSGLTSVGLSMPSLFSVSGSPLTSNGTISVGLSTQTDGYVFAAPSGSGTGTPSFRALVANDIPSLPFSKITGTASLSQISTSGALTGEVLTYNGSAAVWAYSGGNVSGAGVANQLAVWNGAATIDGYSNLTWNNTNGNLTVDGYLTLNYNSNNTVIIGSGSNTSTGTQAVLVGYNNSDLGGGNENIVIGSTSSVFGSGSGNIVIGNQAASGQSGGYYGIAIGYRAGYAGGLSADVGQNSIAIGTNSVVTGIAGIAMGYEASNTNGGGIAIGNAASSNNSAIAFGNATTSSGTNSLAVGNSSSSTGAQATSVGYNSNTNGYGQSTAIGYQANSTASNQIVLGTGSESIFAPGKVLQFGGITSSYPSLRNNSGNILAVRLADNSADGYLTSGTVAVSGSVYGVQAQGYDRMTAIQFVLPATSLAASTTIAAPAGQVAVIMPFSGSLAGISLVATQTQPTAGTLTVTPVIAGVNQTGAVATYTTSNLQSSYAIGTYTFTAGQVISLAVATSGTWTFSTSSNNSMCFTLFVYA